jgi:hypothetical protein
MVHPKSRLPVLLFLFLFFCSTFLLGSGFALAILCFHVKNDKLVTVATVMSAAATVSYLFTYSYYLDVKGRLKFMMWNHKEAFGSENAHWE